MEANGTVLKVSPLLATLSPAYGSVTKAKRGHGEATLAQRVRVTGKPERDHPGLIFSLPARSKWSQIEPNESPI